MDGSSSSRAAMAETRSTIILLLLSLTTIIAAASGGSNLQQNYYDKTCPSAETTVRFTMKKAKTKETRSVASVMRLQFHDCFVNGCDGSLLLDDTPTMLGEKLALSNINSLRSFDLVDDIKQKLETICPGIVSCADIIIMAARDAVFLSGGPFWEVKTGRLDSLSASQEASNNIMPSPRANATSLIELFRRFDISVREMVALSGSHSIGRGRCFSIVFRLYNQSGSGYPDPEMDWRYRERLDELCPEGGDGDVTGGLDSTEEVFDNQYFKDLVRGRGFLNSDQTLFTEEETRGYVMEFGRSEGAFFEAFAQGMVKMGDLQSGLPGEVRRDCRKVNEQLLVRES